MNSFHIGAERCVRRLGFGAMHLPTDGGPARENAIAVVRRAVDLGVTLIDTAHLYGWGANEELLAEALHPYPDDVLIATKIGVAPPNPPNEAAICGRPDFLRDQVDQGLRRLRVDWIELLQLHRIDPEVPLADQLGTLRDLQVEGKIGHLGLSEITVAELTEAQQIISVASVQNRYSMMDRDHEAVLDACTAADIAFLPWRPVLPAVSDASAEIVAVAGELNATHAQVALAWLFHRSPVILPIPGTSRISHLEENVAAANLRLSDDQYVRLDRLAVSGAE